MPNSVGTHSYSTLLSIDPNGGTSYVAIGEVFKLALPGIKVGATEVTNLNSPGAAKEFRAGLIDGGDFTASITWTQGVYNSLLSWLRKSLMSWKITFPLVGSQVTAATVTGAGHITELPGEVPEDDRITNDLTIKVSGVVTLTLGS